MTQKPGDLPYNNER